MSEHAELNLSAAPAGHTCPGKSYIAAGFVKWIEAAGGRAVPIRFYASDEELYRMFKSINGLVFPGGLTWLWLDAPYVITARKLFNWAVQANDAGDVFPIHGTCLGFQLLHILASNISRNVLLVDTDSVAHPTTLKFWGSDAADNSRMFASMPAHLRDALESPEQNIVLQNHMYGMPPAMYTKHPVLASWYNIISTSMDRNGTEYISTMEGKKYPFTGMCLALLGSLLDAAAALTGCGDCGLAGLYTRTQWHPEKPPSEFGMLEVPHSIEAISVSQHLANMFMESARRSSHVPESKEEELALLIYDTCPVFSERFETTDEENYDGPDITYYL
ncbi:hypothetical protein QJQ45_003191 [Haematococcus lacustris]|nr:hypothetical protein QJQ45_003191 [Haematococcus lacustris]